MKEASLLIGIGPVFEPRFECLLRPVVTHMRGVLAALGPFHRDAKLLTDVLRGALRHDLGAE